MSSKKTKQSHFIFPRDCEDFPKIRKYFERLILHLNEANVLEKVRSQGLFQWKISLIYFRLKLKTNC